MFNGQSRPMKNHPSRLRQLHQNPITMALTAQRHQATLCTTRLADQFALQAVETGTASQTDINHLRYLAAMLLALARAGFGFAGITMGELQDLCRAALARLDMNKAGPAPELQNYHPGPVWRRLDALHQAQLDACSPAQYLRARCSLLS